MPVNGRPLSAVAFLFAISMTFAARAADPGVTPEAAVFTPGKEVKILDPKTGGLGWYVVYVPKDYTPDREWPTIFCYHGKNNDPKTWPFREVTEGKNFIIVGMEYLDREGPSDPKAEVANLDRIRAYVGSKVRINSKLIFMGGFSQGGWSTSRLSNLYMDQLAGLLILGAGGSPDEKVAAQLKGKPVFIGIGEADDANKFAQGAKAAYAGKGVDLTFEEWKGLGHSVDTKSQVLKDWLQKYGPKNQMMAALVVARAAEKAGKLGEAYNLYVAASKMQGGQEAGDQAKAIGDVANKKIADAKAAIAAKKYPDAIKALVPLEKAYAGSTFAEQATTIITQIRTDPAIKAEVEQARIDTVADAIQAQAQAAEKAKEFARAMQLYESYLAQCAGATKLPEVKAHYDKLKGDPAIIASAKSQAADRECKGWLSTADNYINNNMGERAKPYLQKILDKYGTTPWAAEAKKRMAAIKN